MADHVIEVRRPVTNVQVTQPIQRLTVGGAGAPGLEGDPGAPGTPGTDGTDGESAYQIAVDNGYVGTEAQWVASLQGPAGPGGNEPYVWIQSPAASTWVIVHNKGFHLNWRTVDSTGREVKGDIVDVSTVETHISFTFNDIPAAFEGKAYGT